jgi:hypothetical protein
MDLEDQGVFDRILVIPGPASGRLKAAMLV